MLSVFWGWKRCARDFYIFGQCSRQWHHDCKPHEQQRGNQHVALGDIPPHEQESAQSQHAGAHGDGPAKPSKKHSFQTRRQHPLHWGAHTRGNARRRVWAGHSQGKECRSRQVPWGALDPRDGTSWSRNQFVLLSSFQFDNSGPTYSAKGRMMRLLACCSMMWAHQPVIRLATKMGVYCGTGMPMEK